jgi:hypothetical protein
VLADLAVIAVVRRGEEDLLFAAGADLVVATLDAVDITALAEGRLA